MLNQTAQGAGELAAIGGPCREDQGQDLAWYRERRVTSVTFPLSDRSENAPSPVDLDDYCVLNDTQNYVQRQDSGRSLRLKHPSLDAAPSMSFSNFQLVHCPPFLKGGWITAYRGKHLGRRHYPRETHGRGESTRYSFSK